VVESFETSTCPSLVRYMKPKILTVDLPASLADRLRNAGYNVLPGAFGRPYKVPRGDTFVPVVVKASVPNYSEQELVVIDLTPRDPAEGPEGEKVTSLGEPDWFAKTSTGVIDPRPRMMAWLREDSDRILKTGGVFVIFAEARDQQTMVWASVQSALYRELNIQSYIKKDNWCFLTALSPEHLRIESDYGTEIKVREGLGPFSSFLHRPITNSIFSATLHPLFPLTESGSGPIFFPLATSKFGDPVAAALLPRIKGEGFIVILPQLEDKENAVLDLIQNVLPEIFPRLFPDQEGGRWVHREEYEHPSILKRKVAQLEIQEKANEEIARLDQEIDAERGRLGFLHGILTKSGDALVADVKLALESIGFSKVVDVDEGDAAEGSNKRTCRFSIDRRGSCWKSKGWPECRPRVTPYRSRNMSFAE